MKAARFLSSFCICIGIAMIFLPHINAYQNWWDSHTPYFKKLNNGFEFLKSFGTEKSEKDQRQREKALNNTDEGFIQILDVLKSNSEKLRNLKVQQITNRRESGVLEISGNRVDLLNIIFVYSNSTYPPYIAVTSETELEEWIQSFKKRWMLLPSVALFFIGGLIFLAEKKLAGKLGIKWIILIVLLLFFLVPVASLGYGALSWKDFLTYLWFVPLTIVALFQDWMKRQLFAPQIQCEFALAPPFCLETKSTLQGSSFQQPAHYFRFRIKNVGDTQARLCECVVDQLWLFENNIWKEDMTFQPINLNWSNQKSPNEFLDINPKSPGWFCDLVHIDGWSKQLLFDYKIPIPNSQCHVLKAGIKHRLKVTVYGENFSFVSREFEIFWTGQWKDKFEDILKEVRIS